MSRSSGRAAFVPVVYGGVVLLLLVLGVLAHGFTRNIGDARLVGRYATLPLFQTRTVRDLTVSWNGLSLKFSAATTPALQTLEFTTDGGTDLVFSGDIRLHLAPGRDTGGSVSLAAVAGSAPGGTLLVPFSVAGVLLEPSSDAALSWNRAGHAYVLSLPSSATADMTARVLRLPLDGSAWTAGLKMSGTTVLAAAAPYARPAAARLPDEKLMPSAEQLAAGMKLFTDAAYLGWSQTRLGPSGTWKLPDGTTGFSDDIGIALLAESIARGTFDRYLTLWTDAQAAQSASPPDLALRTSTYGGGVRDYTRLLDVRAAAQIAAVRPLITASDAKALATPHLLTLVADHGDAQLLKVATTFITSRSTATLDAGEGVGLLEALVDATAISGGSEAVTKALKEVVEKRILPSLRSADGGIFLDEGNGTADVETGIRAGALLITAGGLLSDTRLPAYGRGLLMSGLALADAAGILPVTLTLASGKISKRDGALGPESVYPLLPLDRRVAREIPLAAQLGPGAWIWTSASIVSLSATPTQITLVLGYPAGVAHNAVIRGIRPFGIVRLHGTAWHTDPTYSKYSAGWAYDSTSATFYLKVTGKTDQEQVDIVY